ncbi:MAG TPA: uracil-DNA glycosylase [Thermoflexia bacterium]|jgi:DNA polymerase|nr:uracil-DNA glycosylase [Thermoflexia bacterium]
MASGDKAKELERIAEEVRTCTACILHRGRTQAVPGEGPADAQIMFIGEAPGFHEDQQGRPFVGAAGRFLEDLLESIGLKREDVYITNIIKCRPPANRDPLPDEIEACGPFLERQLEVIRPKLVVTLGRFSMARFFPKARISQIHGQAKRVGGVVCLPMYHPAAALHQPSLRRVVEEDFRRIPEVLAKAEQIGEYEPPPEAEQLRLF